MQPSGGDPTRALIDAWPYLAGLILVAMVGGFVILVLRRTLLSKATGEADESLMGTLRSMRDSGQISLEEYEASVRSLAQRVAARKPAADLALQGIPGLAVADVPVHAHRQRLTQPRHAAPEAQLPYQLPHQPPQAPHPAQPFQTPQPPKRPAPRSAPATPPPDMDFPPLIELPPETEPPRG
jgi:hypothetical protein